MKKNTSKNNIFNLKGFIKRLKVKNKKNFIRNKKYGLINDPEYKRLSEYGQNNSFSENDFKNKQIYLNKKKNKLYSERDQVNSLNIKSKKIINIFKNIIYITINYLLFFLYFLHLFYIEFFEQILANIFHQILKE